MNNFLDENFLLGSDTARELYHSFAKPMPIFDYHCHLPPREVAENKNFLNLTDIWLKGDHYKWRAMRAAGVDEKLITGDASDEEKFLAWARTVPKTLGNPLFSWTHLELKRYFGIEGMVLSPDTAREVWDRANGQLSGPGFRPRAIMEKFRVKLVCTTDDPADDLAWHRMVAADPSMTTRMLPAYRPDQAMDPENAARYNAYLETLGTAAGLSIRTFADLVEALDKRHRFFHENGCRLTDHALVVLPTESLSAGDLEAAFRKVRDGKNPSPAEADGIRFAVLQAVARMNARRGWTMQLHLGAVRNINSRMFAALGANTGYDAMGDGPVATGLVKLLDSLEKTGELPRTILYSLNPRDNEVLLTIAGSFQGDIPGKMQLGSGWWYNDQKDGMEEQMRTLANMGLLSVFVGMLTDSRSFMSYPRHEYFRRVLCGILGGWVDAGEAPRDLRLLGGMVEDICYNNAKNYFHMSVD